MGSLYASSAMAVVKPSLVKVKAQVDRPAAWGVDSAAQGENPSDWDPGALESASKSVGDGPVGHHKVIDYNVVNSHTVPDLYIVPILNEQGLILVGYTYYMFLDIYKLFFLSDSAA